MTGVVGRCPACLSTGSLFVGADGHIACGYSQCPNPAAVDKLLAQVDEHVVVFDEDGWTIEHTLACRVSGRLAECRYNAAVRQIADQPDPDLVGRWEIAIDEEGLPLLSSLERRS